MRTVHLMVYNKYRKWCEDKLNFMLSRVKHDLMT